MRHKGDAIKMPRTLGVVQWCSFVIGHEYLFQVMLLISCRDDIISRDDIIRMRECVASSGRYFFGLKSIVVGIQRDCCCGDDSREWCQRCGGIINGIVCCQYGSVHYGCVRRSLAFYVLERYIVMAYII